ncbi:MAG: hypothetical protein Q9222_001845 [Ikaeria aurantiellina]
MTLYAPDGLPIVLMERFEGLTAAVDCKGDDGAMSLTFTSKQAYDYALKIWGYINEDDDKQFLLIANHDGCGKVDQRQPYKVSAVLEDVADLAIKMTTSVTRWSEVGGTYDLDFGKATPQPSTGRFKPRGFWGDIVDVGKTVLEAAQGDADVSKSMTFDVNVGTPGQKTNIYTDEKGRFSIDCVDCYIKGSWHVQGHITVRNFVLQDLLLEAAPSNFLAKLGLEATVTSSKSPDTLQESKEIFSAPIPGAGISVTGIFKLGATVSLDVGTSATFAGTATADFGLQASLPNGAKVVADINNPSGSSATGWQGSSLTPTFDVTKLSASITLAAFSQPKIAFGVELIEVGQVDVAVTMKLPEISSTLSASYGVCPSSKSKTGVKLENKATESLSLQIDLDLGDDDSKPSWSKTLLDYSQPLGDACFPLNIPGLGTDSASSTTPKPSGTSDDEPTSCSPPGKSDAKLWDVRCQEPHSSTLNLQPSTTTAYCITHALCTLQADSIKMPSLVDLPNELLYRIISAIDPEDIEALTLSCKTIHDLAKQDYARFKRYGHLKFGYLEDDSGPDIGGVLQDFEDAKLLLLTMLGKPHLARWPIVIEAGSKDEDDDETCKPWDGDEDLQARLKHRVDQCEFVSQGLKGELAHSLCQMFSENAAVCLLIPVFSNLTSLALHSWSRDGDHMLEHVVQNIAEANRNAASSGHKKALTKLVKFYMTHTNHKFGEDFEYYRSFALLPSLRSMEGFKIDGDRGFEWPTGFPPQCSTVTTIKIGYSAVTAQAFEGLFSGIAALKHFTYEHGGCTVGDAPYQPVGIIDALRKFACHSLETMDIEGLHGEALGTLLEDESTDDEATEDEDLSSKTVVASYKAPTCGDDPNDGRYNSGKLYLMNRVVDILPPTTIGFTLDQLMDNKHTRDLLAGLAKQKEAKLPKLRRLTVECEDPFDEEMKNDLQSAGIKLWSWKTPI